MPDGVLENCYVIALFNLTKSNDMLNKNLGYKKARPIRSNSYLTRASYIATCDQNFDIKLRPRIS